MEFKPFKHQELIIDHLNSNERALVFAGMGLGKTASTLLHIKQKLKSRKGILIVAPLRVSVLTWPKEVLKWDNFKDLKVANLRTKEGKKAWENNEADIYTINYEALPKFMDTHVKGKRYSSMPADTVVFDEISLAKNPKSKRIHAFRIYSKKFPYRIGLTGTPVPNGYIDLFAQVRLIDDGERLGKFSTHYRDEYFKPDNFYSDYPKWILKDGSKEIIEDIIGDITINLQSKTYLDIPPTTFHDEYITLDRETKKEYTTLEKELLIKLNNKEKIKAVNLAVLTNKLLQMTGGNVYKTDEFDNKLDEYEVFHDKKIKALEKISKKISGKPLLIACQFKHEREQIVKQLGAEEWNEDTSYDRWNKGEIKYLVAHPKSLGHGLNLQEGGSHIVWYSLNWSQELYEQMNARLARTGQKEETHVYHILMKESIDDAVLGSLQNKCATQNGLFDALDNLQRLKGITPSN